MAYPIATYRLQLNHQFDFDDLIKMLPFFDQLSISTLYLSPITKAQPKSLHGYDVVDPNQINPELGGLSRWKSLIQGIKKYQLNILLDIVPNHMSTHKQNFWWQDVLVHGKQSNYAHFFDIKFFDKTNMPFYRRFFDINELVCLRMEDKNVFYETHRLIQYLAKHLNVIGFRIDHIDGLRKPTQYLKSLNGKLNKQKYIIVEKILAKDEPLSEDWPIDGTTGYDFLNELNQIFIYPHGFKQLTKIYDRMIGETRSFIKIRYQQNKLVIHRLFAKELNYLTESMQSILKTIRLEIDISMIKEIITEFSACLPVYRTYIDQYPISDQDQYVLMKTYDSCAKMCVKSRRFLKRLAFTLLAALNQHPSVRKKILAWINDWQLFTAPMIAKGYEDTTCYIYNPLLSLNEVGSSPDYFVGPGNIKQFHQFNSKKQQYYPYGLNATSTHDTKRSEDVRARLNVLSEIPKEWHKCLADWRQMNQSKKIKVNKLIAPDANEEIFIYQSLLGAWPLFEKDEAQFLERFHQYLRKATREAKIHSSWQTPSEPYEAALQIFAFNIINARPFFRSFIAFQNKIRFYGYLNSLAQVALKILLPGVPDFYQGNELWRFDLVDPDNRRPIDFKHRVRLLAQWTNWHDLQINWTDGRIKLFLIQALLNFRGKYPSLFSEGDYIPLTVKGARASNLIAFLRKHKHQKLLVVVPRWYTQLIALNKLNIPAQKWEDTHINLEKYGDLQWQSIITGEIISLQKNRVSIKDVFKEFTLNAFINC